MIMSLKCLRRQLHRHRFAHHRSREWPIHGWTAAVSNSWPMSVSRSASTHIRDQPVDRQVALKVDAEDAKVVEHLGKRQPAVAMAHDNLLGAGLDRLVRDVVPRLAAAEHEHALARQLIAPLVLRAVQPLRDRLDAVDLRHRRLDVQTAADRQRVALERMPPAVPLERDRVSARWPPLDLHDAASESDVPQEVEVLSIALQILDVLLEREVVARVIDAKVGERGQLLGRDEGAIFVGSVLRSSAL